MAAFFNIASVNYNDGVKLLNEFVDYRNHAIHS